MDEFAELQRSLRILTEVRKYQGEDNLIRADWDAVFRLANIVLNQQERIHTLERQVQDLQRPK